MANRSGHHRKPLIYHSILSAEEIARIVQANYALAGPLECSLFNSGVNDTYLVVGPEQRSMLRIARVHRYGAFDESAYRFELDLLGFLHEKGLPVAYPLPRRDHDTLGVIHAPEGKRHYALFTFADGEILPSLDEAHACILGETLASLHLAMSEFSSPHPRFHLDEEFLIDEPMRRVRMFPQIAREDMRFLETLAEDTKARIQNLPRQSEAYGIIHGDFWWKNVHFSDGKPTFFDFDFCGCGWRAYDVGALSATARMFGVDLPSAVVDSFVSGYETVRPLTALERAALPAFERIRAIWAFGLWSSFAEVHGTRWFHDVFADVFASLKKWVEGVGPSA